MSELPKLQSRNPKSEADHERFNHLILNGCLTDDEYQRFADYGVD